MVFSENNTRNKYVGTLKTSFTLLQCSPFITLYLGSIGMDHIERNRVIKGQFSKVIIGKFPFHGHFPVIPV